jgi:hypothetical protein
MECNICFEILLEDPGSLHSYKPCRIFRSCDACAKRFLSSRVKELVTECPGGCGSVFEPVDFRKHLGFMSGDLVEARWRRGKGFFAGEIVRINEDDSYRIRYDDGDLEPRVERGMIRWPEATRANTP